MTRAAAAMASGRPGQEHAHVATHVLDHLLRHDEPTPNARAVREPGTRRVTAIDADRLIREHAAALAAEDSEPGDGLGKAWQEYTQRKQAEETPNANLKRHCTVRMCEDVLMMLSDFGLVVTDRTAPPPRADLKVWRSTDRFRAHVAAGGGPLVWQTLTASPSHADPVGCGGAEEEEQG